MFHTAGNGNRDGLGNAGFNGTYTNKVGKTHEGCAMFWRRSRFAATAKRDVDFRKFFASMRPESEATQKSPRSSDDGSSGSGSNAFGADDVAPQLLPMLEASPHLVDSLQRVGTIAQMVVLRAVQARGEQSSSGKGADALRHPDRILYILGNTHSLPLFSPNYSCRGHHVFMRRCS